MTVIKIPKVSQRSYRMSAESPNRASSSDDPSTTTPPKPQIRTSRRHHFGKKTVSTNNEPTWPPSRPWEHGRVLVLQYRNRDHAAGRATVVAHEFHHINTLANFYKTSHDSNDLKVIHVQNAPWATRFLGRKYAIKDDIQWDLSTSRMQGNRPLVSGSTFEAHIDLQRRTVSTAFFMDYLKLYEAEVIKDEVQQRMKLKELNEYDQFSIPAYSTDVFAQRIGVYVQTKLEDEQGEDEIDSPIPGSQPANKSSPDSLPQPDELDNENTVIVIDNSVSCRSHDTLISARGQVETRWRRLPFFLPWNSDTPTFLALINLVTTDIFQAVAGTWRDYRNKASSHVLILQDRFYDNPTDASRAPELWNVINHFISIERVVRVHSDVVRSIKPLLTELYYDIPDETTPNWLGSMSEEFERLADMINGDLIAPTNNVSDQMYQAVAFRDSRDSLQFNASLWRLSWITFIFLPLNFINGFFGMNVDVFESFPSIKFYFIAIVIFMLLVLLGWQLSKLAIARSGRFRAAPYAQMVRRRGVYKGLYHDLAQRHPDFWTRSGPRHAVIIDEKSSSFARIKWRVLKRWFAPEETIYAGEAPARVYPIHRRGTAFDAGVGLIDVELGPWGRFKHWCARRWLDQLKTVGPELELGTTRQSSGPNS